ncbi:GIY-YIG nuclease family protein [Rhodovastum atsumiense]|uniref:GIY-YIG nuclease family protein n=1 Tax=Rhodovastum atsumiense TaxID=504468 RepID=UPI00139F2CD5|nr:GIY-YIG nuclease family protein [Rhodovastum atsumiense]CAH2601604.1 GIY-YIG nuclease family protein [Rhodovastum atsumiense]
MTTDVYLIAGVTWERLIRGQVVTHSNLFKIGYSANPFDRLKQVRANSSHNLALFGVILCENEQAAAEVEKGCHKALAGYRRRGEWFRNDVRQSWKHLIEIYPTGSIWLTDWYDIDLDRMQLAPFPPGAKFGVSDNYHAYARFKEGLLRLQDWEPRVPSWALHGPQLPGPPPPAARETRRRRAPNRRTGKSGIRSTAEDAGPPPLARPCPEGITEGR